MRTTSTPGISVVIPVYNEAACFSELHRRVLGILRGLDNPYELIYVDDASGDGSLELMRRAAEENPCVRYLSFSRNFGHQPAITAGLRHATGDVVVVMDGDLQDPPELIPRFLEKWKEGADVIYGLRRNRKENFFLRFCYSSFYRLFQKIADIQCPLDAGDFCLMDRSVLDVLNSLPERNRFVRGIRAWAGFRQEGVEYDRDARAAGETKYSLWSLFRLAVDGITSFSNFPLRLCIYMGWSIAGLSLLGLVGTIVARLFVPNVPIGWASVLAAIFFLGGVQLTMLGVVGIYIGRIHKEVQQRPHYLIRERGNFKSGEALQSIPGSPSPE